MPLRSDLKELSRDILILTGSYFAGLCIGAVLEQVIQNTRDIDWLYSRLEDES